MDDYHPAQLIPAHRAELCAHKQRAHPVPRLDIASMADTSEGQFDTEILLALRELQEDSSPNLLSEVFEIYLCDAQAQVSNLRESVVEADLDRLLRVAHTLKGSSSTVGAAAMARLCQRIEEESQSGNLSRLSEIVGELGAMYQRTSTRLLAELGPDGRS